MIGTSDKSPNPATVTQRVKYLLDIDTKSDSYRKAEKVEAWNRFF